MIRNEDRSLLFLPSVMLRSPSGPFIKSANFPRSSRGVSRKQWSTDVKSSDEYTLRCIVLYTHTGRRLLQLVYCPPPVVDAVNQSSRARGTTTTITYCFSDRILFFPVSSTRRGVIISFVYRTLFIVCVCFTRDNNCDADKRSIVYETHSRQSYGNE